MKRISLFVAALSVCALTFFSGCAKKDAQKGKGDVEAVFAVNAYKVVPTTLDDYLEFGGDVDAASSVAVMPDTAGKISQIYVKVGQRVSKGQMLCAVDASRPGMIYAASPVRSPVDGTVVYFPCVIGTSVAQSSIVAKIASTSKLEIETSVPERFVSRIAMNQKAKLSFNAYPGETFDAHITEISPVLDTSSRTMNIKLAIDKQDSKIKIGMYAKIHLVTEHKNDVTVLPYGTVITRNGENYVFIVAQDGDKTKAVMSPVKVGIRVDNYQEILQGVTRDDLVIVKGQTLLSDGSLVNVVAVTNDENRGE
ncbi:efflux RND transporter periplasmic adaptor subunit [Treponema sp.]|uniref:efflux RND transporter periplasmic adaptor subunit n=1 Tax=Treponema sp. TaxID=166 RepID=UPI00298ECF8E|nr:efflux RND transporter periplasmic adaptor subunit [Treponema sp.]MCR5612260.1 efflux RND transporter periplasmic adaptor subunit [Treponema sp.]